MTDIVARARTYAKADVGMRTGSQGLVHELADEIERLRALVTIARRQAPADDEIIRLRAECGAWVMKNAALHNKEIAQLRRVLTES